MAPKKATPMEEPPSASSSSEEEEMTNEEEEGSEEESSSEEEEEDDVEKTGAKTQKPSTPQPPPRTQTQAAKSAPQKPDSTNPQAGSDSEGESDSGSESDESESEPERTVKPIASKPMAAAVEETPVKTTNPKSKPSETASEKRSEKRVSETDLSHADAKRAKKKDVETAENSEDTKKQLKGKWSEEDEITLFEGIVEYTKKKGIDPSKDLIKEIDSFREFIKKRLHVNVNSNQLKDKIWRTKKKFNGKDLTFSKPHEQKLLDLTKKLWSNASISGDGVESSMKSNGKVKSGNNINQRGNSKKVAALKFDLGMDTANGERDKAAKNEDGEEGGKIEIEVSRTLNLKTFDEMANFIWKKELEVMGRDKKAEMDEKWKELHVLEMELFLKRIELLEEQTKLTIAHYKG